MGLVLLGGQARLFKNIERAIAFAKKSGVRKPNKQKGKAKKKQKGKVGKKKRKQPEDLEEFY
jgi:hypothetical protein